MDQFLEIPLKIVTIVGMVDTIVLTCAILYAIILWGRGISPTLIRLGNGLAKRKIAIFAKGDNVNSLKALLIDSGLFRQSNIFEITSKDDLGKAEKASVYLLFWHDWSENVAEVLSIKPNDCPLVVYAPYEKGRIPDAQMSALDGKRNTAVTNFRGRLLNDIVTGMITTSYKK